LSDLVYPLFIKEGMTGRSAVESMPGIDQLSLEELSKEAQELIELGVSSVILFGIPSYKDASGSSACRSDGIIQRAIRCIKQVAPELLVIADLCLCEYTDHGHCGLLRSCGSLDHEATLPLLVEQAVSLAKEGADVIAPSGMIDGMVHAIRTGLDLAGFSHVPLLSYAVKYCSSLYGPFRQAAEGAPQFGSRASYQLDPANCQEGLREAFLDVQERADLLMVKPAHTYLDMICRIKEKHSSIPLGAYHTSGEYAMIKAAAEKGWIDERKVVYEVLTSIKRAGADFIITYYAKQFATW
jgi:porphobilinogen synthase